VQVRRLKVMRPRRGRLQRAPGGFSPGGRRSVGAGCASRRPKRSGVVVRGASPGVDGATPSIGAQATGVICSLLFGGRGRDRGSRRGLGEAASNGHPEGSLLEGAAPSAPVARRVGQNGRAWWCVERPPASTERRPPSEPKPSGRRARGLGSPSAGSGLRRPYHETKRPEGFVIEPTPAGRKQRADGGRWIRRPCRLRGGRTRRGRSRDRIDRGRSGGC